MTLIQIVDKFNYINDYLTNKKLASKEKRMEEKIMEELDTQNNIIQSKIYFIRELKVMLDRDLAELYNIKPTRLREQVKRNLQKFPKNFMFQLTENETDSMVSQNAIPSRQYLGGHLPFVFTEYGALQLANVIKSDRATQVSIQIIEIFIKMRELISTNQEILSKLKNLEENDLERSEQINMIFMYIHELENNKKQINDQQNRNTIGFKSSKNK